MAQVTKQQRAMLEASGEWERFHTRRKEFRVDGMTSKAAQAAAWDDVLPRVRNFANDRLERAEVTAASARASADAEASKSTCLGIPLKALVDLPVDLPAIPVALRASFQAPSCSFVVAVRWVAANMAVRDVKPEKCPGAEGWGLLQFCRESPQNRVRFWGDLFKTLFDRTELVEQARFEDDGREVLGLIESLQRNAASAVNGRRVGGLGFSLALAAIPAETVDSNEWIGLS